MLHNAESDNEMARECDKQIRKKNNKMADSNTEVFLNNNSTRLKNIMASKTGRVFFALSSEARHLYSRYLEEDSPQRKNEICAQLLNIFEDSLSYRLKSGLSCACEDLRVFFQQIGTRAAIDNSDPKKKDYYSIVVVIKNEARYIKEFILFYLATGADRIYIYDNDSTDDLLGQLEPFLVNGTVVYKRWSGPAVQTAAYRDAVRKTRKRTKWLAVVDADEFLFSPKGNMPDQLKAYERYPGVCANWVMFGPNGHDRRPAGLVMDNYTSALADHNSMVNCHIKSIVQPSEVRTIRHTHFAMYKRGRFAVDETGENVDNNSAYVINSGRALTEKNHREVFRINHYVTKSLEDLEAKCKRGYADGAPNAVFNGQLAPFRAPMEEDFSIKLYADAVKGKYNNYH